MDNYGHYQDYMHRHYPHMKDHDPMRYPDIYYIVYPIVRRKCEEMDAMHNPMMHPYPSCDVIDRMTDDIYEECKRRHPDMMKQYGIRTEEEVAQFGPRGLLRGLIGTLLIRDLLRRRRRPFAPGFGYGYGPGFGYNYGPYRY